MTYITTNYRKYCLPFMPECRYFDTLAESALCGIGVAPPYAKTVVKVGYGGNSIEIEVRIFRVGRFVRVQTRNSALALG